MSLKKATFYSIAAQGILKLISFISIIVLARLLTPEELGIYAIASSSIFIARELQNLGTINYLIKIKVASKDIQQTCFGVSLLISWTLGTIIFFASGPIANLYNQIGLQEIYQIFSITFFITPFTIVPQANLRRNMQFDRIMIVVLSNQITAVTVTIWMVLSGYSYLGIAYGQLIGSIIAFIMNQILSGTKTPLIPKFTNAKEIFSSGLYYSLANSIEKLSYMSGDLIIGKIGSTRDVAILSRGIGFIDFLKDLLSMGIKPIVLPYLSEINRNNDNIAKAYIQASYLLGSVLLPVIAVAGASAEPTIMLFFGPQWGESATLVPGIATWFIFKSIHILSAQLFIVANKDHVRLVKETAIFLITSVIFLITYKHGLFILSWCLAGVGSFEFIITSWFLFKYTGLNLLNFGRLLFKNIILTLSCLITVRIFRLTFNFNESQYIVETSLIALLATVCWLLTAWILKHRIFQEIEDIFYKIIKKNHR